MELTSAIEQAPDSVAYLARAVAYEKSEELEKAKMDRNAAAELKKLKTKPKEISALV